MEIETRTENKNKEQRKNKLGSMSFIKCIPKAKKNKRKFTLFHPQMGPKNKTSFIQKRTINNLQLFTIRKHTQNSSVFPLTNKTTKSTKPTITTQQFGILSFFVFCSCSLFLSLSPYYSIEDSTSSHTLVLDCLVNILSIIINLNTSIIYLFNCSITLPNKITHVHHKSEHMDMMLDFFFESSKGIFEVTSTPKNTTIASAA